MELAQKHIEQESVVVCPLGDFQYSGKNGPTAEDHLKRHIDDCLEKDGYFIGTGDYSDFMSPSNRARLKSAGLYDTAKEVIEDAATELVHDCYEKYLKVTKGRWLGLVEGHHFFEYEDGTTSDKWLSQWLGAPLLGTSALFRVTYGTAKNATGQAVTMWVHHGKGGGSTPGAPLNTLDRVAQGWDADVFLMGHTTKTPATRFSRVTANWSGTPELIHKEILLVNTGGFCKTSMEGSKWGAGQPRGDYAEQRALTPSPLSAPILYLKADGKVRVEL